MLEKVEPRDGKVLRYKLEKILCSPIFLIALLYTAAHGLILINHGIYWDDWTLFNMRPGILLHNFKEAGYIWFGYLHIWLLSLKESIIVYRMIVFAAFLGSGLFLYFILKRIKEIDDNRRLLIVLFFEIFPTNSARIAVINSIYAICYFFFFLGFLLLVKYEERRNIVLRLLSLVIFFASFTTNSFLVFYGLVPIFLFYRFKEKGADISFWVKQGARYLDFILLPVFFWIIKLIFFRPTGNYAGYNQVDPHKLISAFKRVVESFFTSFVQVFWRALTNLVTHPGYAILIIAVMYGLTLYFQKDAVCKIQSQKTYKWMAIFGLFVFFAGVYPYNVVGLLPGLNDWNSRHQLLVPLGSAFMLVFGINFAAVKLKLTDRGLKYIFIFLIMVFLCFNIQNYLDYQMDWYKQLSLITNFKTNPIIKNNTSFLFEDYTLGLNANNRVYRPYEYAGMMKYAFGNETRFGIDKDLYNRIKDTKPFISPSYNSANYKMIKPEYKIDLYKGALWNDSNKTMITLGLVNDEIFKPRQFHEKIRQLLVVKQQRL